MKILSDKTVLLRERKRHTARRVASTHSVVLGGGGGVPTLVGGVPTLVRGEYLPCWGGTHPGGGGVPTLVGGTYPGGGVPTLVGGTYLGTYPPPSRPE